MSQENAKSLFFHCFTHNHSFVQHPNELGNFYCWFLDGIIKRLRLNNTLSHTCWFSGRSGRSTAHVSSFFYLPHCDTELRTLIWRTIRNKIGNCPAPRHWQPKYTSRRCNRKKNDCLYHMEEKLIYRKSRLCNQYSNTTDTDFLTCLSPEK